MSQLDLALEAEISPRHLSFVETGRSQPSREVVLSLAERLDVPLRERNLLLTAAGYAPLYPERAIDDPALAAARSAVDLVLKGHEPYPAIAVNRHWEMVAANGMVAPLLAGVDPSLLTPPVNVLRPACTRKVWRRALPISANGARISFTGCGTRQRSRPIPSSSIS